MTSLKSARLLRRTAGAAAAICALLPATAAQADLLETGACDDAALSQPFAPWGDHRSYKLAPGGDFEGDHGWKLSGGAKVVSGSEPYGVTGAVGARSISIPAGGSVTSPATCVNIDYPSFRFFTRSSGGFLGLLPAVMIDVLYGEGLTKVLPLPTGLVLPSSRWQATGDQLTVALVGATLAGGEAPVAIRITSVLGTWSVDDVFVDPIRRS